METMTLLQDIFDFLLGLGVLWLAWKSLTSKDLVSSIVLFMAFGLLMALAWVSLNAPDVALAEAAVGAGLTGAMLLATLAKLRPLESNSKPALPEKRYGEQSITQSWLTKFLILLITAGLSYAVLTLSVDEPGLSELVANNLDASGVKNPVTAVLLNFRGYDTMLEMIVLLLALIGVWSLGGTRWLDNATPGLVLTFLSRFLTPLLILVAGYLLWVGGHAPGGALQAGAVLGAAGVLLLLTNTRFRPGLVKLPLKIVLIAGPGVFCLVAILTMLRTGKLLEFPPEHAGTLILILETAATISIGVLLAALFWGAKPDHEEEL